MTENSELASERIASDAITAIDHISTLCEQKKTLSSILLTMQKADAELMELTPEAQAALVSDLKEKVDSYKYIDEKFAAEISRISEQIEELQSVKKSLANNKAKLRELMAYHMKEMGYQKLPGELYQVALVTMKDVDLVFAAEPTASSYLVWGPEMVNREYSWNTKNIKKKVLSNPEEFKEFGTVKDKSHVKFTIKRELQS